MSFTGAWIISLNLITILVFIFYSIPNREEIRRHWVKVLTDSGYKVDFDTAVCSRHFHKSDFYYQCELGCPPKKLLKSKALPIITPNIRY